jgi:hypothetical protein
MASNSHHLSQINEETLYFLTATQNDQIDPTTRRTTDEPGTIPDEYIYQRVPNQ